MPASTRPRWPSRPTSPPNGPTSRTRHPAPAAPSCSRSTSVPSSRVALVTGSSRGLGAAIARRLARDRFAVAVNCLEDTEAADRVAAAIRAGGGTAGVFAADATDERAAAAMVEAIGDELGPIAVLVLNATGPQPEAGLDDVGWDDHLAQLEFFVKSPV